MQTTIVDKTRRAARKTDYYIHDNAWTMMAVTAGLAFVAGFLLSRQNQEAVAYELAQEDPEVQKKIKKASSFEFVHSIIPLTLFLWKAMQTSRCARRANAWERA